MSAEKWKKIDNPGRRDSFSSVELQESIADDKMDSITFQSTMPEGRSAEAGPSTTSNDEFQLAAPKFVRNLILASRALRRMDQAEAQSCVYKLRRKAKSLGGYDNKAEFARVFKEIEPPVVKDPEPEYVNQVVGEQYSEYALPKIEEALRELVVDGRANDKRVQEIKMCLQELRECIATWRRG